MSSLASSYRGYADLAKAQAKVRTTECLCVGRGVVDRCHCAMEEGEQYTSDIAAALLEETSISTPLKELGSPATIQRCI
jgi:hypothetical protein